jgi:hypothetical protein
MVLNQWNDRGSSCGQGASGSLGIAGRISGPFSLVP